LGHTLKRRDGLEGDREHHIYTLIVTHFFKIKNNETLVGIAVMV
jgi:hypothetical protein